MLGCANSKSGVDQSAMLGWPPSGEWLSQFSCAHGKEGGRLSHAEIIGSVIPAPLRGTVSFSVRNEWLSPGHWEIEAAQYGPYTSTHGSAHGSHGLLWRHGQWTLTQTPAAARPHSDMTSRSSLNLDVIVAQTGPAAAWPTDPRMAHRPPHGPKWWSRSQTPTWPLIATRAMRHQP